MSNLLDRRTNPLVGDIQRLRQNPALAGDGHEICISNPTRQYMHVDMSGDPGAGGAANVHAHVDTVGGVNLAQNSFQPL